MSDINIKAVNNTSLPQGVQILNTIPNPFSANNSNYLYEYDVTGQDFSLVTSVTIEISNTSNPTIVSYTVPVLSPNIQGVIDALNTLNFGNFSYFGNIIYVPENFYVYGNLEIVTPVPPITGFVSTWNTANTSGGSSNSDQIQLPLQPTGTYNFVVDWGDGNTDTITSWNQAETLHTYATSGTYTITIDGVCQGWVFNDLFVPTSFDVQKILSISNWGSLNLGNSGDYFNSCDNLDLSSVSGILDLTGTTNFAGFFANCTSLTTIANINNWNTSFVTNMGSMFSNATSFNQDISSWNVSNVTNMSSMFQSATAFNQDISSWDVSSVTNMNGMFNQASSFNQPIGSWDVSSVVDMNFMFLDAIAFNQNISSWNISNVASMSSFMTGKSTANYSSTNLDAIYNSWSLLTVQPNVTADFGTIQYTSAGLAGRNTLDNAPNNWTITDGGIVAVPFVSTWNTANTSGGSSTNQQVLLPLESTGTYNFVVDWGDGNTDTITTWNQAENLHTYATSGIYTITISGTCIGWRFNNTGDKLKITSILQWGDLNLGNNGNYFDTCQNLNLSSVSDILDLTGTTNLSNMFRVCSNLTTINNIGSWNVSSVTNMSLMFNATALFNQDLNTWNVSNVTNMAGMFATSGSFNGDISSWDVSSVTNMQSMFFQSGNNKPIGSWNVSNVTNMQTMFQNNSFFNQPIDSWNVSSVLNMQSMFSNAIFNQPINSWDVSNVANMNSMFNGATSFNQPISSWDISSVTSMNSFMSGKSSANYSISYLNAIYNAWSLLTVQSNVFADFGTIQYTSAGLSGRNTLDNAPNNWTITDGGIVAVPFVSTWNTANTSGGSSTSTQVQLPLNTFGNYNFVVDWGDGNTDTITVWNQAETLHTYASSGTYNITIDGTCEGWSFNNNGDRLKILSVDSWGSLRLGNTGNNFWGCANLDLSSVSDVLYLTGVTDLSDCFDGCTSLTTINNVNSWDVSSVQQINNMFQNCSSFNQSLNSWDVSSVASMVRMFYGATIFNGNIGSWDVSSVTNMYNMFGTATAFNQDINSWDVSNVTNMQEIFAGATSFNQNIGSWDMSSVSNITGMFLNATSFNQPIGSWNVSLTTSFASLFFGATSFNQPIDSWDVSNVTITNGAFFGATSFNQPLGSWDVSSVGAMAGMFQGAIAFNQDISTWDISSVTSLDSFMTGKSSANYSSAYLDAIYNSWSLLTLQPTVNANFGTIKYTASGSAGKAILQGAPNNWTVTDGGI